MLPEEEVLFKAYIRCLDEILEDSKLGKKNRDKVINRQFVRATRDSRLIKLHDWIMNKPYNVED